MQLNFPIFATAGPGSASETDPAPVAQQGDSDGAFRAIVQATGSDASDGQAGPTAPQPGTLVADDGPLPDDAGTPALVDSPQLARATRRIDVSDDLIDPRSASDRPRVAEIASQAAAWPPSQDGLPSDGAPITSPPTLSPLPDVRRLDGAIDRTVPEAAPPPGQVTVASITDQALRQSPLSAPSIAVAGGLVDVPAQVLPPEAATGGSATVLGNTDGGDGASPLVRDVRLPPLSDGNVSIDPPKSDAPALTRVQQSLTSDYISEKAGLVLSPAALAQGSGPMATGVPLPNGDIGALTPPTQKDPVRDARAAASVQAATDGVRRDVASLGAPAVRTAPVLAGALPEPEPTPAPSTSTQFVAARTPLTNDDARAAGARTLPAPTGTEPAFSRSQSVMDPRQTASPVPVSPDPRTGPFASPTMPAGQSQIASVPSNPTPPPVLQSPPDTSAAPPPPSPSQIQTPPPVPPPAIRLPAATPFAAAPLPQPGVQILAKAVLSKEMAVDGRGPFLDVVSPDAAPVSDSLARTGTSVAPTTTALPGAETARHAALQILDAVRQGSGTIDITLNPEELGRMRLSVAISDGAMIVNLTAERPETLDLMRRHIDILQSEARAEGFSDLSFSFSGNGQGGASADGFQGTEPPGAEDTVHSPPDASHVSQDGLDLRL